jgi:hypothetical protein
MAARRGHKPHIPTTDLLEAVSVLGVRWTMIFHDWEVTQVNEALDRELYSGNLDNAYTVSSRGYQALDQAGHTSRQARIDIRLDPNCPECRLDHACWVITCTSCHDLRLAHVRDADLVSVVTQLVTDHVCPADEAYAVPA